MLISFPTHSPQVDLKIWASRMLRNSSRNAPVSATLAINSTQTHQKNLSDTWSNTNTGHHSKWSQPVSKLPQPETLPDRSLDTEVFHSKSSVSDMLTLLKISRLFIEKHGFKIQRTDKTQSNLISSMQTKENSTTYGLRNSKKLYENPDTYTSGLSLTA